MKGDFTRDTFDPTKHFSRVLMQQGRVTLDSDNNEQTDILLHYIRTLARDLIGPYAGPIEDAGFKLRLDAADKDLWIGKGRYYVDGILVENDGCYYATQPDRLFSAEGGLLEEIKDKKDKPIWIYLDIWERHISFIEDDAVREKALNGPDTCTRAKVVWQVRALELLQKVEVSNEDRIATAKAALNERVVELKLNEKEINDELKVPDLTEKTKIALEGKLTLVKGRLSLVENFRKQVELETDADTILKSVREYLKEAQTRKQTEPENQGLQALIDEAQWYIAVLEEAGPMTCDAPLGQLSPVSKGCLAARVDPGQKTANACLTPPDSKYRGTDNQLYRVEIHDGGNASAATFKWSRDNGSIATAWLGTSRENLKVSRSRGFEANNWVELSDDAKDLQGVPGVLVKLNKVEGDTLSVDAGAAGIQWSNQLKNPKVRRWDQSGNEGTTLKHGVVPIKEGVWINLEDGIQIKFKSNGDYRTGDYWLIPARVATGKIEWPGLEEAPDDRPPHGIEHHYAPLGFVTWQDTKWKLEKSCGCVFEPQSSCYQALSEKVKLSPKRATAKKKRTR